MNEPTWPHEMPQAPMGSPYPPEIPQAPGESPFPYGVPMLLNKPPCPHGIPRAPVASPCPSGVPVSPRRPLHPSHAPHPSLLSPCPSQPWAAPKRCRPPPGTGDPPPPAPFVPLCPPVTALTWWRLRLGPDSLGFLPAGGLAGFLLPPNVLDWGQGGAMTEGVRGGGEGGDASVCVPPPSHPRGPHRSPPAPPGTVQSS